MAWYDFILGRKGVDGSLPPLIEQKKYTTAELLALSSRGKAEFQKWDTQKAISEGMKLSAIFYACVRVRYEAIGSVPWKAYKVDREGNKIEVPKHPLQQLIDKPNPDFSWSEMMQYASMHLDLAGNSYWSEIRGGNNKFPIELWPLLPYCIKIQPGAMRLVESYIYTPKGANKGKPIPAEDIVQLKTPNPDDFLFGLPTIQAAGRAVDIDRDAGQWQKDSLHNRGVSDYAVILDPDTTQEQYDRIRDMHKEQIAGPHNARKPWYTTKDVKPLNQSAVEMDFNASRRSTWQEIASAMGVPLPMVGILDDATLANIDTSRRIFWLDTIIPVLSMMRDQLQTQLASEFGPDIVIDYVLDGVEALRENVNEKIENAKGLWGIGVPLEKLDAMFNLGIPDVAKIPGANTAYISSTVLPTDFEESATVPPISPDMTDAEKAAHLELLKVLAYGSDKPKQ